MDFSLVEWALIGSQAVQWAILIWLIVQNRKAMQVYLQGQLSDEQWLAQTLEIQESTASKLIQSGFDSPEKIAETPGIQFAQNSGLELSEAGNIYSQAQKHRNNPHRYRYYWLLIIVIFAVMASLAAFIIVDKTIIEEPKINPAMILPEVGEPLSELDRIKVTFDKWIDQTKVNFKVLFGEKIIPGGIVSWNYQSITWQPSEVIAESGIYKVEVGGKQINKTIFYFTIK